MEIEKIPIKVLYAVRQRLGAKDELDTSEDERIKTLSPKELIAKFTGWHLGDEDWGRIIIDYYDKLGGQGK